ncbi:MAG: hypothetical protein P4L86_20485 [Mycobacterium sp.]|nr:hypothetical protein [Mycobacterium sp.]
MTVAGSALVVALAAIVAGWNYVSAARKMRSFNTTRGTVLSREVVPLTTSLGVNVAGAVAATINQK